MDAPQELSNNKNVVRVVALVGAVLGIVVLSLLALLAWGVNHFHSLRGAPATTVVQSVASPPESDGVGAAPAPSPVEPPTRPVVPPVARTPTPPANPRTPDPAPAPPPAPAPAPALAIVPETTLPGVLQGHWRCTTARGMPSPLKCEIRSLGGGRIRLQPGSMRGIYELRGDDLVMVEPDDRRFAQIVLHINSPDEITVTQGKSYPSVGADYAGMRFTRQADPGAAP